MSVPANGGPGGTPPSSGGTNEPNPNPDQNPAPSTPPTGHVSYESHQKLLDEKKKADAKLAQFQQEKKDREEAELVKTKQFESLVAIRDQELKTEKEQRAVLESRVQNAARMSAFLKAVNGSVDPQYHDLVDLEKIPLHPETKQPDEAGVQMYAREFEKKYALVIQRESGARLPNQAPAPTQGKITEAEWLKLPLKEMKARLKDVIAGS